MKPGVIYAELLQAANTAELETGKSKGSTVSVKALMPSENQVLTSMGSKLDQLASIVKLNMTNNNNTFRGKIIKVVRTARSR